MNFSSGGLIILIFNWDASDDTIMTIATGLGCLNGGKKGII